MNATSQLLSRGVSRAVARRVRAVSLTMVKRSRAHASLASDNLGEGPKKARPATTAAATGRWAGLVDEPPQPRPRLVPRPPRDIAPVAVAPPRVAPVAASKPQLAPVDGAPLFRSLSIAPSTLKAIVEDMGYQSLTPVQAATLPVCLRGGDVLAKAKARFCLVSAAS